MTPRRKKGRKRGPSRWSFSAGERPYTVLVRDARAGLPEHGPKVALAWNPIAKRQVETALGAMSREDAVRYAMRESEKLAEGLSALAAPLTVATLMALYLQHQTPNKANLDSRKDDARRAGFWTVLYGTRRVRTLGRAEWEDVRRRRATGEIDQHGHVVTDRKKRVARGPRTVAADLQFASIVCNWAKTWNRPDGGRLLSENPFDGLELPVNPNPARPIRTHAEYLALRKAAESVRMQTHRREGKGVELVTFAMARFGRTGHQVERPRRRWMEPSYLPELLDLCEMTGRRVIAVLDLRYSDIVRREGQIVALRWRPVKHAKQAELVPVADAARAVLERIVWTRPGVGDAPMFPSFQDPTRPVSYRVALEWYEEAEQRAELAPLALAGFHVWRRKWATERKAYPEADVAAAGGWKDRATLRDVYQLSDPATMKTVLNEPVRLTEVKKA